MVGSVPAHPPLSAIPAYKGNYQMKQRDFSYPKLITKTKSKRYISICPHCHLNSPVFQFRIQASEYLRNHLRIKHKNEE